MLVWMFLDPAVFKCCIIQGGIRLVGFRERTQCLINFW